MFSIRSMPEVPPGSSRDGRTSHREELRTFTKKSKDRLVFGECLVENVFKSDRISSFSDPQIQSSNSFNDTQQAFESLLLKVNNFRSFEF